MLPKRSRLTKKDIPAVLKGQTRYSTSFTLRFKPSSSETSRFAVIVSKKVAKSAVDRNALRRRGYAALREALPNSTPGNLEGALFMKKEALKAPYAVLMKEIRAVFASR